MDFSFRRLDGGGGTLAQTYFPEDINPVRIAGDVQFDSSETWEIGNQLGRQAFDLLQVAVHEIGHALGLPHGSNGNAVLAPTVSPNQVFTSLDQSDIDAILSLYAPAGQVTATQDPTLTPTTPTSTEQPEVEMGETPTLEEPKDDESPAEDKPVEDSPNDRFRRFFRRFQRFSRRTQFFRFESPEDTGDATSTTEANDVDQPQTKYRKTFRFRWSRF